MLWAFGATDQAQITPTHIRPHLPVLSRQRRRPLGACLLGASPVGIPAAKEVDTPGPHRSQRIARIRPDLSAWIGRAERPDAAFARFEQAVALRHRQLPEGLRRRLARQYGASVDKVLGSNSLGAEVALGLFEAELGYLHDHEWARNADNVLWRRTKLGLHLDDAQCRAVAAWCKGHWSNHVAPTPSSWG